MRTRERIMIDDGWPQKTAESAYDTMLELFEHPEPSQAWVDEFNRAAAVMERRSDDGIDDGLPTTNHVLPWIAWLEGGRPYIASPPIVLKGSSIRLTLDVLNPLRDMHINVHAIPCDDKGNMLDKMSGANTACLIISPDAGPAMIFAGWDYVAREGIDAALASGAILTTWVQVVTAKVPCVDLSTIEEQHAMKMLKVYSDDKDLERAIVEYRKVFAGKSYGCMCMAVKYNKLRFHLEIAGEDRATVEAEQVRLNRSWMAPRAYKKWLLDGVQITYDSIQEAFSEAEAEIYGDRKVVLAARAARNGDKKSIVNARAPGDGIPVRLVGEEWAFSEFFPVAPDESTNRTEALRAALVKAGRKGGFDGRRFDDAGGVICSEVVSGMVSKGTGATYTRYKGILIDTVRSTAVRYEYLSCLKGGGFAFLR